MTNKWKSIIAVTVALAFSFTVSLSWAKDSPPVEAFKNLGKAVEKKDWGSFYDGCEKSTQQTLGQLFLFALAMGAMNDPAKQKKLEAELGAPPQPGQEKVIDKAMFIKIMKLMDEIGDEKDDSKMMPKDAEIVEKEVKGDRAVLSVKEPNKPAPDEIIMVREEGAWKFFMANPFEEAMKQQKGGADQSTPPASAPSSAAPPATPPAAGAESDQKAKDAIKKFFKNP